MVEVEVLRSEVDRLEFPPGLLPPAFTLGELQAISEAVLERGLDKSSLRRRIADREIVEEIPGEYRLGANRPAQVFRLRG